MNSVVQSSERIPTYIFHYCVYKYRNKSEFSKTNFEKKNEKKING